MLGGRPLLDGDGVLINDNASQAWWRASIRETRGRQALIHYTGCDPAWDEWIDVDSPKLIRMDDVESRKDESAFQSDTAMEGVDDEELLEQYRQQRWEDNARWQLNTFAQAQLGSWKGTMDLYSLDAVERVKLVQDLVGGSCSSEARVCASNTIEIRDEMPAGASSLVVQAELGIQSFRPEVGNMAVASAFSLTCATSNASSTGGESDAEEGLLVEIALGEEQRRVRCKLLYAPPAVEGDEPGTRCVSRVAVVREVRGGGEFIDGNAGSPDIDGTPGRGLYDPPKVDKSRYISLYCEGGVTLVFPTAVPSGEGGVISLDWIAVSVHRVGWQTRASAIRMQRPAPPWFAKARATAHDGVHVWRLPFSLPRRARCDTRLIANSTC